MPNPAVQRLFDRARALRVGFYIGYAEQTADRQRYNCSILVDRDGAILGRYRKVHLPGSVEPRADARFQQLEKRYFSYGDLGFPAFRAGPDWCHAIMGMMICNDRRGPESWRVLGLQGVELVCVGYNSAAYDPNGGVTEDAALRTFHSTLVTQANAYMNATWAIAVAKAGDEDGSGLIGGSCIVDPNGRIVAEAATLGDEVVVADLDLDLCRQGKDRLCRPSAARAVRRHHRACRCCRAGRARCGGNESSEPGGRAPIPMSSSVSADVANAPDLIEVVTATAAALIRRPDLGAIAPGATADLTVVDLTHPHLQPLFDPRRGLIALANRATIDQIVVDGRVLIDVGRYVAGDEATIISAGTAAIGRIWDLPEAQAAFDG